MKIGVAVPAYNVLPYIENCLTTLGAQLHPVKTYICDDASDDGTFEFLLNRPSWYHQLARNKVRYGWPASLNRAVRMAFNDGCDAVFLMNADDFLRLDCISRCVQLLQTGKDWVVTYAQQVGGENVVQASRTDVVLEDFLVYPPLVNYALIPRDVWATVRGYPLDVSLPGSFGYKEDWAFWIEVFKHGFTNYGVVTQPTYYYVMHPGQLHQDSINAGLDLTDKARELILSKHPIKGSNR